MRATSRGPRNISARPLLALRLPLSLPTPFRSIPPHPHPAFVSPAASAPGARGTPKHSFPPPPAGLQGNRRPPPSARAWIRHSRFRAGFSWSGCAVPGWASGVLPPLLARLAGSPLPDLGSQVRPRAWGSIGWWEPRGRGAIRSPFAEEGAISSGSSPSAPNLPIVPLSCSNRAASF